MCGFFSILEDLAAVVGTAVLGPEVGAGILGAGEIGAETLGDALVGGGLSAATSEAQGGNPLIGGLEGAVGGAVGANAGDILSGAEGAVGLGGDTATPAGGTAPQGNSLTGGTSGEGGVPNLSPTTSVAAPATGGVVSPTGASQLGDQGINLALSNDTTLGTPAAGATTGVTDLGSVNVGGDTSNIGPIQSTPTTAPSGATNLTPAATNLTPPGGTDLALPSAPTPADTSFVNGTTPPAAAPNIGQGPTVSAATAPSIPTPSTSTPGLVTNLEQGNLGAAAGNVGTFLEKNPSLALGAGFAGYEALQGPAPLSSAGKALEAQGNTLNTTANTDLAAANAGNLTGPQQAQITEYIQGQTNQLYQQLASMGISNPQSSTQFTEGMQQIQQQATAMAQSYIQQSFTNAMSAAGSAASDLSAVAQEQTAGDTGYTQALSSAVAAIGGMYTLGGMKIQTQPATQQAA